MKKQLASSKRIISTLFFSILLSAFRKGYSCQSVLLNMIEKFKSSLDKGDYVACISMDTRKALIDWLTCIVHIILT